MAKHSYDESLRRLLIHEGGYSNHPQDPGGPTNYGITIHDARKYWKADATAADVRAMPIEVAKGIYKSKYWNALRCDELPPGVDYSVFDYGVNSGTSRAAKVFQRVLAVPVTGGVDDLAVAAARERNASAIITAICDERLRFLQGLSTWPVFGAGWGRRVREVRAAALCMAAAKPAASTPGSGARIGKGEAPLNRNDRTGTVGAIIAGGAAAAQQAHQAGARPAVIALIIVATITLAVGGFMFWRRRQRLQQEKAV